MEYILKLNFIKKSCYFYKMGEELHKNRRAVKKSEGHLKNQKGAGKNRRAQCGTPHSINRFVQLFQQQLIIIIVPSDQKSPSVTNQ